MRRRFPSPDNPNPLFSFAIRVGMDNQQNHYGFDHPDRMPSLLTVFEAVRHDKMKRVIEHLLGEIECNPMFGKVASGLFKVPFKSQSGQPRFTLLYIQFGKNQVKSQTVASAL